MCYIPSPMTFSATKLDFVPEVPCHRESFLMRLRELLPGSMVDYLHWALLSWSLNISTCLSRELHTGRWTYKQTLYHVDVKAKLYGKPVEMYYNPCLVTINFVLANSADPHEMLQSHLGLHYLQKSQFMDFQSIKGNRPIRYFVQLN